MAVGDACLLDSNILLRTSKSDDPQQAVIGHALRVLVGQGVRLCYTSQTLGEFWNASTRPFDKNGFGLSVAETDRLAQVLREHRIEALMHFAALASVPDSIRGFGHVKEAAVEGAKANEARLWAAWDGAPSKTRALEFA